MAHELRRFYAHTLEGRPPSEWQDLREHLENVAESAGSFASHFEAADWGRLSGWWHDLGKYQDEFQDYLAGIGKGADHAIVGALLAKSQSQAESLWLPPAFVIAGHHTGLANRTKEDGRPRPLQRSLKEGKELLDRALPNVPVDLRRVALPELPARLRTRPEGRLRQERLRRSYELWVRFLFSALVDADFLDTEEFYGPGLRARTAGGFHDVPTLRRRLDRHVDRLAAGAETSEVNQLRAEVLAACRTAAAQPPGFFSLSVPTGGGKTLSGMAFALRHAEQHGLRRVIAVIPYTSIIEQNAAVYFEALGADNVIEHHSNLDPEKESDRNKLVSENWDAPVIVTTGVQFFESLFANRVSRCRKVHNVAGSVILLDEAQTLPAGFLIPILDVLRELTAHYGCSVVLSTATQPALERRPTLPDGLEDVTEIAPSPRDLATRLRRFDVTWPDLAAEPTGWPQLAAELAEHRRVLAIVHLRRDARELAALLPEEGLFHLSALMCPAHRSAVLKQVCNVAGDRVCRLVSTQLIEAGVDVDFPVVYRALGGLDSLVQAGGRCNREGTLASGRLVVYRAPTEPPPGTPRQGLETMESLLRDQGGSVDPVDPEQVAAYFRMLFHKQTLDVRGIQAERQALSFATVARRFRLIEDGFSRPIVVPYGEAVARLDRYRDQPSRDTLRALQPYVVNVPLRQLETLREILAVEEIHERVNALAVGYHHLYDSERYGLVVDEDSAADPEAFMV